VLRPSPSARNGAAARPGCPFRLCPLERPKARPPPRSAEPKIGLVLSPQAAGLACPQLCRRWLTAATAGSGMQLTLLGSHLTEALPRGLKLGGLGRTFRARRRRQGHGRANNIRGRICPRAWNGPCPRCVRSGLGDRPALCIAASSNAPAVDANTLAVKKHARVRALQHDQRISIGSSFTSKTRARERSELFSLRSCRRVYRRAGSRRAEARRNRSPRRLRGTKPRAPYLPE